MNNSIKCRKCNGNHLTIKCTLHTNNQKKDEPTKEEYKHERNYRKSDNKSVRTDKNDKYIKESEQNIQPQSPTTVKISNLPFDISENELWDLTKEWGNIKKIKVVKLDNNTAISYITFKYENQADYFIKALHKTNFEYYIIHIIKVNDNIDIK